MGNSDRAKTLQTFEARADKYDAESSWIANEKFIKPLIPQPFGSGKLLDVCSGTGALAKYAKSVGWEVTASDLSSTMLKHIPDDIEKVVADVENLPFEENAFDVISCRQGLQYVDIDRALLSMARVSKSQITLAQIVIFDKKDVGFWKEYFQIAKTGRLHVFFPGMLSERISKLKLTEQNLTVLTCWESLISPSAHLEDSAKKELQSMLINSSEEFKARNHIVIDEKGIFSERRWEIIKIQL